MWRIGFLLSLGLLVALVVATAATAGRSSRGNGVREAQIDVCPTPAKPSDNSAGGPGGGAQGGGGQAGQSGQGGSGGPAGAPVGGGGQGSGPATAPGVEPQGTGNPGSSGAPGSQGNGGNAGGQGNAGGNGHGTGDDCVSPPADPAPDAVAGDGTLPVAKAGTSVNVEPVDGIVNVKEPGSDGFKALAGSAHVPEGTVLDTRAGTVELTSEGPNGSQQTAAFSGAKFQVRQAKQAEVTDIVLRGGDFANCPRLDHGRRVQAIRDGFIAARGSNRRHLWGNGRGRFRTRGRWGSATVRGTIWQVEDRCDGTLTTVARGVVDVADFGLGRTVSVRAGEQYFSKVRR